MTAYSGILFIFTLFLTSNSAAQVSENLLENTRIVFESSRDGNSEIYVMRADGAKQSRLTSHAGYEGFARWSPDGKQIAFVSDRDGNPEIYMMNADGSNQTRLTNNPAEEMSPTWSPFMK